VDNRHDLNAYAETGTDSTTKPPGGDGPRVPRCEKGSSCCKNDDVAERDPAAAVFSEWENVDFNEYAGVPMENLSLSLEVADKLIGSFQVYAVKSAA
jgi:hypothetical protein